MRTLTAQTACRLHRGCTLLGKEPEGMVLNLNLSTSEHKSNGFTLLPLGYPFCVSMRVKTKLVPTFWKIGIEPQGIGKQSVLRCSLLLAFDPITIKLLLLSISLQSLQQS